MKAEMYRQGMSREDAKRMLRRQLEAGGVDDGNGMKLVIANFNHADETVWISNDSIEKMTSGKAVRKSVDNGFTETQHHAIASDIVDLFKNSLKVAEHPNRKPGKDIEYVYRFATPLQFKGAVAFITVMQIKSHGKKLYSVEGIEIRKLTGMLEELDKKLSELFPSNVSLHIDNIRILESKVNTQGEKV